MPELNCYGSGNHHGSVEVQVKQTQCWKDGGQAKVSVLGVDSLWSDCTFSPSD